MSEYARYRTVCGVDACLLSCFCRTGSSTMLDVAGLIQHGFARRGVAALLAGTCLTPIGAFGQTWVGATGDFNATSNWSTAGVPAGLGVIATFADTGATSISLNNIGAVTIGTFQFDTNAQSYTFDVSGDTDLLFRNGAGIVNNSAVSQTINGNSAGKSIQFWDNGGLGNTTFNLNGQALILDGAGVTGGTATINSNAHVNLNDGDLQNATLNLTGFGALRFGSATASSSQASVNLLSATSEIRFIGYGATSATIGSLAGSGRVYLEDVLSHANKVLTIGSNNQSTVFSGQILEGGAIVKEGTGTLTLSGNNDYSGGTTINDGAIAISNNVNLGDASGTLAFGGGTLQTTGSLSMSRATTLNAGGGTFDTAASTTLSHSGVIDGAGALTKAGAGTLSLSGVSSYQGGTTINGGTLAASSNASLGDIGGGLAINNGATFRYEGSFNSARSTTISGGAIFNTNGNNGALSGVVSGSGGLVKTGAGTLGLGNASNTYTGGTTISGGTLGVTSDSNLGDAAGGLTFDGGALQIQGGAVTFLSARAITLNAGGGAVDTNSNSATLSGNLTGGGGLTKTGLGTVTLTGANDYTGGTTVAQGSLMGSTTSLQGAIVNNDTVIFNQGTNGDYAGAMSGAGILLKIGAGTVTLSGINTYTGGTTVAAGTLVGNAASLQGNITNLAALIFDQSTDDVYGGAINGTGSFVKSGAGRLNLTGANTYTGATAVNDGTLSVNGSITSAVTVNSGGALGGGGIINGAVSIGSGGAFAPGNSIGTITVNGSVDFAAGSIYRVEADAAGNADRINVAGGPGTASLNGTVDVQAGAGSYQQNTQYTILNAAGGVTGMFNAVTSNLAFLTPTLSYDANNVFLALARNDVSFASVAATPNQQASATALQAGVAGASGDMATVTNAITSLSAPQARAAYDAMGGASLVALRRAGAAFAGGFGQQLIRRLGAVAPGNAARQASFGSPLLLAANDWQADGQRMAQTGMGGAPDSAQQRPDGHGLWLRGYGAGSNTDSDGNAAADTLRGSGLSVGIDTEVREGLMLGAAFSHGTSRISFSNAADNGRSRDNAVGVYGSYGSGLWTFKGQASLAWNANHMERAMAIGPLVRTASSDFSGSSQALYGEATYDIAHTSYLLQPLAALSYVRSKTDGFTETGAGALNLQVAQQTTTSVRTLLGAKTVHEIGRSLKIEPRLMWAHEFGNVNAPLTANFTGAPGAGSFQVSGVALKRDSLVLGLGVSGQLGKGVELVADGQLEGNAQQRNLAFFAGLRGVW